MPEIDLQEIELLREEMTQMKKEMRNAKILAVTDLLFILLNVSIMNGVLEKLARLLLE